MAGKKPHSSAKQKLRRGDVFQISIDDARVGYGQVVDNTPPNPPYIAIFQKAYPREKPPDLATIVGDQIKFLASSLDAKIWNGDWKIVGNAEPDVRRIPFPSFKTAIDNADSYHIVSYDGKRQRPATPLEVATVPMRKTVAPIRLERALQAFHSVGPWRPEYDELDYKEVMRRSNAVKA